MLATTDTSSQEVTMIDDECALPQKAGNYEPVRLNAMTHGILARSTVLPHEDSNEFSELLAALIKEHRPSGMTEHTLIEELAAIVWRKRRVLLAEGATINRGLRSVVHDRRDSPIPAAAPFEHWLKSEGSDLPDLLSASTEEIAERQRDAELDLAATRKALAILRKARANAYEKARRVLIPESRG